VPPVRLFIGNLPYQATEEDLRSHFATVGEPTQIVRPLDRETGRARGFAFVEYADRSTAEAAIQQFDGQLFMGRPLAVSEARAREDRGPGGPPRPGGGFGGPRPGGPSGFGGPRPSGPGAPRPGGFGGPRPGGFGGPRPGGFGGPPAGPGGGTSQAGRERNFGPPAPPKGKKGGKGSFQQKERGPKGPIPTKFTGRMYDLDEVDQAEDAGDDIPEFMKPEDKEADEREAGDTPPTADAPADPDTGSDRDDED
jgi:RNA recognition motif-containing protein